MFIMHAQHQQHIAHGTRL